MSTEAHELDFMKANPFVVVHEHLRDGSFSVAAYPTMPQALRAPRLPECKTPTVFGSWPDYQQWKAYRLAHTGRTPADSPTRLA